MKINKTHEVFNTLHNKNKNKPYDIVRMYCRYCQEKLDIHVYHALGTLEHYQLVNLPEKIAKHLKTRKIECTHCNRNFVLEKSTQDKKSDFILKLDCSNMSHGMESWYEDAIPKYSKEPYAI